jgi:hypothetical protein
MVSGIPGMVFSHQDFIFIHHPGHDLGVVYTSGAGTSLDTEE